jgi:hypothetical protein
MAMELCRSLEGGPQAVRGDIFQKVDVRTPCPTPCESMLTKHTHSQFNNTSKRGITKYSNSAVDPTDLTTCCGKLDDATTCNRRKPWPEVLGGKEWPWHREGQRHQVLQHVQGAARQGWHVAQQLERRTSSE